MKLPLLFVASLSTLTSGACTSLHHLDVGDDVPTVMGPAYGESIGAHPGVGWQLFDQPDVV